MFRTLEERLDEPGPVEDMSKEYTMDTSDGAFDSSRADIPGTEKGFRKVGFQRSSG